MCPPCLTRAAIRRNANLGEARRRYIICIRYPAAFHRLILPRYVKPLRVLSNAKSTCILASRSSSARKSRPAAKAANSGRRGESPAASRSALTKWTTPASRGRNSRANVVLPAPFGPAMMMHRGFVWRNAFNSSGNYLEYRARNKTISAAVRFQD